MKLIILLCLAGYCAAQVPQPCTAPAQWEGRIVQDDPSKSYRMRGKVSYDQTNTRFRIIEEDQFGRQRDFYDTLFIHTGDTGFEYRLNLRTRQCNTTRLNRPFRPFNIPPFAKYDFEAELGAASLPEEHMTVQVWEGEFRNKDRFLTTVTVPDCVAVQSFFFSNETGVVITDFFDLNLGISDPTVFVPPTECPRPPP